MDLALKQRLVGAIVLVALGVIFIPMLLDGPTDPAAHDASMRVPEPPDGRMETRRLPMRPGLETAEDAGAAPVTQNPAPTPAPGGSPPAARDEAPTPGDRVVAPEPGEPPPATDADRVAGDAVTDRDRGWGLQVGTFSNATNAENLVKRLTAAGFPAYGEAVTVGQQRMRRVRIGTWPTREQALDAGDRLGREFPGMEITLQQIAEGGQPVEEAAGAGYGWMVQVGSFSDPENAAALRDELRQAGFTAHSDRIQVDDRVRYRVRVGPEIDRGAAELLLRRLKEEQNLNGLVVSHP